MTRTEELLKLCEAATPGPWEVKDGPGAGLEIYMKHPLYPDKNWPAFGTGASYCKKGLVAYETWVQFPDKVRDAAQARNATFIAEANPETIKQLIALVRLQHEALQLNRMPLEDYFTQPRIIQLREAIEAFEKFERGE